MMTTFVDVCRNQVDSVIVDCSLIFTRYLDATLFDDDEVQRTIQRQLINGRLGQFILGRSTFVYEDFSVESGKLHK